MTSYLRYSRRCFPAGSRGFAFAVIAIGALVPAAVISIGAANLFTRNFWKAYVNPASPTRVKVASPKLPPWSSRWQRCW
jgi:Na+/proline symporter